MSLSEIVVALIIAAIGGSGVGGLVAALVVWRKAPHENRATDAGAANQFAEASKKTVEQSITYIQRIEKLECANEAIKKQFAELCKETAKEISLLKKELAKRDDEIARLDDIMIMYGRVLSEWMIGIHKDINQLRTIGVMPAWAPEISPSLRKIWLQEARIMDGGES